MPLSSVIRYVKTLDTSSATGAGKTGLAFGDITAKYLTKGGTLTSLTTETITTLGTYQAPTSNAHIRIKELNSADPTKGVYEIHFHNDQVAAAGEILWLHLSATGAVFDPMELPLYDVPGRIPAALTSNGNIKSSLMEILGTLLTETAGQIAAAFKQFFDVATPTGTMKYLTRVALVDTVTTNTDMRGTDNAATAIALGALQDDVDTLLGRITAARAGYLDNLNVGGAVASQADINALNQSASRRVILTTVGQYERPESGSTVYTIEARTYSDDGVPMDATGTPTLTGTGQTSGSLAANIGTVTNPSTGVYRWAYTVANNATIEPIRFDFSAVVDGDTIPMSVYTQVADFVAATFTTTDRANLEASLADTNELQTDWANGGRLDLILDARASQASVDDVPTVAEFEARTMPTASYATSSTLGTVATVFSGITSLGDWLRRAFRGDAGTAGMIAAQAEINTGGSSTFNGTTDNLEDIYTAAAAASGGGGGGPVTATVAVPAATARAVLQGSTIGVLRGDTLRVSFTGDGAVGDISGRQKLWFAVKRSTAPDDSAAIILIEEIDNLTVLNGEAPSNANWGTITVTDEDAGELDIVLYASATKLLSEATGLIWSIKQSLGSDPDDATTQAEGKMNIELGIIQATS